MDERYLDEDIARADTQEENQRANRSRLGGQTMAQQYGRQRKDHQRGDDADRNQAEQERQGRVDLVIRALLRAAGEKPPEVAGLHSIEEEWTVVADRANVELIAVVKVIRIGCKEKVAKGRRAVRAGKVDALHFCGFESVLDAGQVRIRVGFS